MQWIFWVTRKKEQNMIKNLKVKKINEDKQKLIKLIHN